jgi:hypothetical protein
MLYNSLDLFINVHKHLTVDLSALKNSKSYGKVSLASETLGSHYPPILTENCPQEFPLFSWKMKEFHPLVAMVNSDDVYESIKRLNESKHQQKPN